MLFRSNSDNIHIKNYLENKFSNVKVTIAKKNLGYGKGNNLGITKVNTKYVFILNPDTILKKNCLDELCRAEDMLRGDFAILAPNLINNFGYFLGQNNYYKKGLLEVDYVKGFAMLINLKKVTFKKIFDENFFLFLEEIDLCKRIKIIGGKIFVVQKSKVQHLAKKASGDSLNIELCRNWHWMWSLFYFNYKHYGVFNAYRLVSVKFILSVIKLFIALLLFNKN